MRREVHSSDTVSVVCAAMQYRESWNGAQQQWEIQQQQGICKQAPQSEMQMHSTRTRITLESQAHRLNMHAPPCFIARTAAHARNTLTAANK